MGRPERPLSLDGPAERFAVELRALRVAAGNPSYRALARRTNYSTTTLSDAAGGRRLPSLAVTLAFAQACGGDRADWTARWHLASKESGTPEGTEQDRQDASGPADAVHDTGDRTGSGHDQHKPNETAERPARAGHGRLFALLGTVWVLGVATGGVAAHLAWPQPTTRAPMTPAAPAAAHTLTEKAPDRANPGDAMDPIRAGCGSPDVVATVITLNVVPVLLPDGTTFGELRLRNNPRCQTSWGVVYGPSGPDRKVTITATRPADGITVPDTFAGTSPYSYGLMLSTRPGCVFVQAFVDTEQGKGPTATTTCL